MTPPPVAGGASFMSLLTLPDKKRRLGTAEASLSENLSLEASHGPTFWWGQRQVVG